MRLRDNQLESLGIEDEFDRQRIVSMLEGKEEIVAEFALLKEDALGNLLAVSSAHCESNISELLLHCTESVSAPARCADCPLVRWIRRQRSPVDRAAQQNRQAVLHRAGSPGIGARPVL